VITMADADKLRSVRATEPAVLSVYLSIPVDLAEHRGLPTRARELIKAAAGQPSACQRGSALEADVERVLRSVDEHSHDWLGRTVAIFASTKLDVFESIPLPGFLTELAVIGARPYIRPLLAAIQRNPGYRAALIDSRHAWIFNISENQIQAVVERTGEDLPSPGFAGWYGLDGYRIQQRIMTLERQHFRDTIAILGRTADGKHRPLVLGGHEDEIRQFLSNLPRTIRQSVAGSFNVDLQTMTPGRVRELSARVIARWEQEAEAAIIRDVLNQPPNTAVTTDLPGCLAASRSHAVAELVLADDQMVPGQACDACGALSAGAAGCDCPDPGACCRAVPDVLDELAGRTLDDGGSVTSVRNPPFTAAARLRFPVPSPQGPRRLP
jgi:hypothetical protein